MFVCWKITNWEFNNNGEFLFLFLSTMHLGELSKLNHHIQIFRSELNSTRYLWLSAWRSSELIPNSLCKQTSWFDSRSTSWPFNGLFNHRQIAFSVLKGIDEVSSYPDKKSRVFQNLIARAKFDMPVSDKYFSSSEALARLACQFKLLFSTISLRKNSFFHVQVMMHGQFSQRLTCLKWLYEPPT